MNLLLLNNRTATACVLAEQWMLSKKKKNRWWQSWEHIRNPITLFHHFFLRLPPHLSETVLLFSPSSLLSFQVMDNFSSPPSLVLFSHLSLSIFSARVVTCTATAVPVAAWGLLLLLFFFFFCSHSALVLVCSCLKEKRKDVCSVSIYPA